MKAYYARCYGGAEVMQLGQLPDPQPGRGEVLLAVRASSLNPLDYKLRDGLFKIVTGRRFPKVFGTDVAGTVVQCGRGVDRLTEGDEVYGCIPTFVGKQGAHAEQAVVAAKHLRALPEGLSHEEAASLPVAALTALAGLRKCQPLAGKSLLITGATGGVGQFAVQMAKQHGARVTAVCSAHNAQRASELGADSVIDYRERDFTREKVVYDVVFDAFGEIGFKACAPVLAAGGRYATTLGFPPMVLYALWRRLVGSKRIVFANYRGNLEDYAELERLLREEKVRTYIGKSFTLDEIGEAYALIERGAPAGKISIRI